MSEDTARTIGIYGAMCGAPMSPEHRELHALAASAWTRATGMPSTAFRGLDETASPPWADAVLAFMARPGVSASQQAGGWLVLQDAEGERMPVNAAVFRLAGVRQAEAEGIPVRQGPQRW